MINEDEIIYNLEKIFQVCEKNNLELTYFEYLTLLGFNYFAEKNLDIAVLEVGLGGRLDATNIIESPIVSVIT